MAGAETTWIARLTPTADGSVAALLDLPRAWTCGSAQVVASGSVPPASP